MRSPARILALGSSLLACQDELDADAFMERYLDAWCSWDCHCSVTPEQVAACKALWGPYFDAHRARAEAAGLQFDPECGKAWLDHRFACDRSWLALDCTMGCYPFRDTDPAGTPCDDGPLHSNCAKGLACRVTHNDGVGHCVDQCVEEGQSCDLSSFLSCGDHLGCEYGECRPTPEIGEPCGDTSYNDCPANGECRDGICRTIPQAGEPCIWRCYGYRQVCRPDESGNHFCQYVGGTGEPCTMDSDCDYGLWCSESEQVCTPGPTAGQACEYVSCPFPNYSSCRGCALGHFCDESMICRPGRDNGEPCAEHEQCLGRCDSDICQDKLPLAETCSYALECQSLSCYGALCIDPLTCG